MKAAWILACTLLFVSVAGFAQAPSDAPLSPEVIAAILGEPGAAGSCAGPQRNVRLAAGGGGVGLMAFCSAYCVPPNSVSCNGSACSGADRNCGAGEQGHVTCDGTTYWCSPVCPGPAGNCEACAQTGGCVDCCRCEGGTTMQCNNCCTCEATSDCMACCRCDGNSIGYCASVC